MLSAQGSRRTNFQGKGSAVAMHRWMSYTLRAKREAAGITLREVEALAGVDRSSLSRYERGEVRWPEDLDRIVKAYAQAVGTSWVALWREALEAAERDPDSDGPTAALRVAAPIRARRAKR
jgi:transcriptional regulator with XRE-family HTH domain